MRREITLEELRKIQVDILNKVADFCEENAIRYWIDCGTLLGAIRHKGYIPWDDDIDMGMLREDYEKFAALFNLQNERYQFLCYENNRDFHLPFAKVLDTSTVLYEPDERGAKISVNIDIFVYDNAPDDDTEMKRMFDIRDKLLKIHQIKQEHINLKKNPCKGIVKVCRKALYTIAHPAPNGHYIAAIIENSKKYATEDTARVGDFSGFTNMVCNKRVFEKFVDVPFEGRSYKAPVGYDEWLRSFYGDYMQLPPEEEQVSHHSFKAFFEDEES